MWAECPAARLAHVHDAYVLWQLSLFHPTRTIGHCHKKHVVVTHTAVAAEGVLVAAVCSTGSHEGSVYAVLETKAGRLCDVPHQGVS